MRKSQRTPKKKIIKSFGFIPEEEKKRKQPIKSPEKKKESPEKRKSIPQFEENVQNTTLRVPHKRSYILYKIKGESQDSQDTEQSTNKSIDTTQQSNNLKSNDLDGRKKEFEKRPFHKMRYDNIGHLPEVDKRVINSSTRCKLEGCRGKSTIYCLKCSVHLCVKPGKNCFKEFHTLKCDIEK